MKTIQLILKGLLFWFSVFVVVLIISAIDNLMYYGGPTAIIVSLLICAGLVVACISLITIDEIMIVSGARLLDKIIGSDSTQGFEEDFKDFDN